MKHSELKQLIREEIQKVLNENQLSDIQIGDRFQEGKDIWVVTNIYPYEYDFFGEKLIDVNIELENEYDEAIHFPNDYDQGTEFFDIFTPLK